jgi:hypothetical protein
MAVGGSSGKVLQLAWRSVVMGAKEETYDRRERLAHIYDMLNALSGVAARDGSKLLRYFVELAAAQARDEYAALDKPHIVDGAPRTRMSLN